jgi:hypothetical protein
MEERAGTSALRVATLNLWGRRGAWDERRRLLAEGFRALAPDLVTFQEAVVGNGYDQVIDILGPGYNIAHQTDRELGRGGDIEDGQGISIASRWPAPRGLGRRPRRHARGGQRALLARVAVAGRDECVLPRRMGKHPPR